MPPDHARDHGLRRAILRLLPSDGTELVLVIDQFETGWDSGA
jgi:hypothetical protein